MGMGTIETPNASPSTHREEAHQHTTQDDIATGLGDAVAGMEKVREALDESMHPTLKGETKITINVGGQVFATTVATLLRPNCLYFVEPLKAYKPNTELFIDRDPKYFGTILNYLRTGGFEEKLGEKEKLAVKKEFIFYKISVPPTFFMAEDIVHSLTYEEPSAPPMDNESDGSASIDENENFLVTVKDRALHTVLEMQATPETTVLDLMNAIETKTNIPAPRQFIFFGLGGIKNGNRTESKFVDRMIQEERQIKDISLKLCESDIPNNVVLMVVKDLEKKIEAIYNACTSEKPHRLDVDDAMFVAVAVSELKCLPENFTQFVCTIISKTYSYDRMGHTSIIRNLVIVLMESCNSFVLNACLVVADNAKEAAVQLIQCGFLTYAESALEADTVPADLISTLQKMISYDVAERSQILHMMYEKPFLEKSSFKPYKNILNEHHPEYYLWREPFLFYQYLAAQRDAKFEISLVSAEGKGIGNVKGSCNPRFIMGVMDGNDFDTKINSADSKIKIKEGSNPLWEFPVGPGFTLTAKLTEKVIVQVYHQEMVVKHFIGSINFVPGILYAMQQKGADLPRNNIKYRMNLENATYPMKEKWRQVNGEFVVTLKITQIM